MQISRPLALLGGLSPETFMRRHWHKRPLLVRQAVPLPIDLPARDELFALAAREDVESRLIRQADDRWRVRHGPLPRRALPPLSRPGWTVLVQGVDLHHDPAHGLLQAFRFVPDARLDDLMISYASDGGGVGPHFDSYDVFLLQVQGRRRWRIGQLDDARLVEGVPLKILANFRAEEEHVLEPGDMLYLPPRWAHDGVAEGECMTASIGFRAPRREELLREVLVRELEAREGEDDSPLYTDPRQAATVTPGRVPEALQQFALDAVQSLLRERGALECALGEYLTEPKSGVWFDIGSGADLSHGLQLDRRTRMMYDSQHVFINGEAFRAAGADARLMRRLADTRRLDARAWQAAGEAARALLTRWADDGWLHPLVQHTS
jgi:50S ribosomal protein L16 3-hydroxylase